MELEGILQTISSLEYELNGLNKKIELEKDNMFNSIVEVSQNLIAIVQKGKTVFINSHGVSMLGFGSKEDFVDKCICEFVHSDSTSLFNRLLNDSGTDFESRYVDLKVIDAVGKVIDLAVTTTPFSYNNKPAVLFSCRDISNELVWKRELELLGYALDNATDAIFMRRRHDGKFTYVNNEACRSLGYTKDELLNMTVFDIDIDYNPEFEMQIVSSLKTVGKKMFETKHRTKAGVFFPVEVSSSYCLYDDTTYRMSIVRDITEIKEKEADKINDNKRLVESERRYREIFDNSQDSILLLEAVENSEFRLLAINDHCEKEIGISRDQTVGKLVREIAAPESAELVCGKYLNCFAVGEPVVEIEELEMPRGIRTIYTTLIPLRDNEGNFYRVISIARDITDHLKIKNDLEINQTLLSKAELAASIGYFYIDFKNNKFHCSKGVYKILGLSYRESILENVDIFKYVHPDDDLRIKTEFNKTLVEKTKFDQTLCCVNNLGDEKNLRISGSFIFDSSNNELFLGNVQDITELSSLEKRVTGVEEQLKILAENTPVGIYISTNHIPFYVNDSLLGLCGVKSLRELGMLKYQDLVHPDDADLLKTIFKKNFFSEDGLSSLSYQYTIRSLEVNQKSKFFDLRIMASWLDGVKYLQILVSDITYEIEREKMRSKLASNSLHINQHNEVIVNIKKMLDELIHSKGYRRSDFRDVINVLDNYVKLKKDWGLFDDQFENIHPNFVQNLQNRCPTLTINDIKHCACIRLNIDTKETARFFNVAPATIQTSRVRLKKKLNLPESTDLRTFIRSV
jgi:PAS domain S-box-containing protein